MSAAAQRGDQQEAIRILESSNVSSELKNALYKEIAMAKADDEDSQRDHEYSVASQPKQVVNYHI